MPEQGAIAAYTCSQANSGPACAGMTGQVVNKISCQTWLIVFVPWSVSSPTTGESGNLIGNQNDHYALSTIATEIPACTGMRGQVVNKNSCQTWIIVFVPWSVSSPTTSEQCSSHDAPIDEWSVKTPTTGESGNLIGKPK